MIDVVDDVPRVTLPLSRGPACRSSSSIRSTCQKQVTSVGATNFAGGVAATEHLRPWAPPSRLLGPDVAFAYNQARMHGYRAALEVGDVELPRGTSTRDSPVQDRRSGGAGLLDLRSGPQPCSPQPTRSQPAWSRPPAAEVFGSEDLSVVGFNDTETARFCHRR